ncbi:MAG: phosphotransferase [Clostridia bacterium]|nr:phosphotransferase [Clostridia bacterium]
MEYPGITEINTVKDCTKTMARPNAEDVAALLLAYGISKPHTIGLLDSSHGADDIRWNYVIDRKYVLRFCNAPEMTESRMEDLNRLIGRYREFGFRCPAFLKAKGGRFFRSWNALAVYLSEYIDLPLGEESGEKEKDALRSEVVRSIARFMERYKGVDLIPTMGMYSLFELCPFDVPLGIDEKQQNTDTILKTLRGIGEEALAAKLERKNDSIRAHLLSVYKALPRCVTQGDENLSNVLVDKDRVAGLIDFNLAGTDVCVNLIANNADFDLDVFHDRPVDVAQTLETALENYRRNARMMLSEYHATEEERSVLPYYAWIALASQYPYACAFSDRVKKEACRESTLALLEMIADLEPTQLFV